MKLPKSVTTVTPLSKTLALLMFILFPIAGFYIGMQYQKALDIYALYPSSVPTKQPMIIKIDMSSIGKNVYAHVGDTVIIALPSNFTWGISVPLDNILSVAPTLKSSIDGYQKVYQASKEGTVTLSASGRPQCLSGHLCSMVVIPFSTNIIVSN